MIAILLTIATISCGLLALGFAKFLFEEALKPWQYGQPTDKYVLIWAGLFLLLAAGAILKGISG
jgi:hypothetical protein